MQSRPTDIVDVCILTPQRFEDPRGCFWETYSESAFQRAGINERFVQDNQSYSRQRGVIRGFHFQIPPFAQAKLVRVVRGAILDVAVDLRRGSATFGRHVAVELTAAGAEQLFIPVGFAHGFCTLEDDTEVFYKVSAPYAPAHERGLLWNDPALQIRWPVANESAILSDKDRRNSRWSELTDWF